MHVWLRLYVEVLNDPKVQKLEGKTFRTWVNLLCVAKQADKAGALPGREDIAFLLRMEAGELETQLDTLRAAGLVEGERDLAMHGWRGRQYDSDADRTALERKRRQRKRESERAGKDGGGGPTLRDVVAGLVTSSVTNSVTRDGFQDVTRTEQSRSRERVRADTEEGGELVRLPPADLLLSEWVSRRNSAVGFLVGFDERDRGYSDQALAKLGGDLELALSCVDWYFSHWQDFWFACKQGDGYRGPSLRRPEFCFRSFADHIEACIPPVRAGGRDVLEADRAVGMGDPDDEPF